MVLISVPRVFPLAVRLLGLFAAVLFAATAVLIFAGDQIMPTTSPLPFYAYPVFVAMLGLDLDTNNRLELTGMEHSPMSATGTGLEPTPWHATQRAAWEVLRKTAR